MQGGLAAMRKALHSMTPAQVMQDVKASKLVGRGGAGFSTGLKWQFVVQHPESALRYLQCR